MTVKREVTPQLPVEVDLHGYQLTYARERLPWDNSESASAPRTRTRNVDPLFPL
jgi:hypothetical protein